MTSVQRNALATELIKIALNPDKMRALLDNLEQRDVTALYQIDRAIKDLGLTRNL